MVKKRFNYAIDFFFQLKNEIISFVIQSAAIVLRGANRRIESSVIVSGSTLFEFCIYLASTSHHSVGIHFGAILLK